MPKYEVKYCNQNSYQDIHNRMVHVPAKLLNQWIKRNNISMNQDYRKGNNICPLCILEKMKRIKCRDKPNEKMKEEQKQKTRRSHSGRSND